VGFDPQRLEIRGTPVPLLDDIGASSNIIDGGGQFAFSDTGTFVYLSGRPENNVFPIQWLDATGKTTPLVAQPGIYNTPRLSPDGSRLAYTVGGGKSADVWVYDLERQTPTQVTFTGPGTRELAWAPDSKHIVFSDGMALWWIRADGSGQPQKLLEKSADPRPFSFSPTLGKDGRLAFVQVGAGAPGTYTLPVDLSDPERPRAGKAESSSADPKIVELYPAFSPDGKFLAYASSESGRGECLCGRFPGRAASGGFRQMAAGSPPGHATPTRYCSWATTTTLWPSSTPRKAIRSAPGYRMCGLPRRSAEWAYIRTSTCHPTASV
jgi:eukaryotic-like serine/threonine-protein kinase